MRRTAVVVGLTLAVGITLERSGTDSSGLSSSLLASLVTG